MKKKLRYFLIFSFLFFLGACQGNLSSSDSSINQDTTTQVETNAESSDEKTKKQNFDDKQLTIATNGGSIPHVETGIQVLEDEMGYEIELVAFDDYVQPNTALVEETVDANIYQHKNHMENYNEDQNQNLQFVKPFYIISLGLFSNKYESLEELPEGAQIGILQDGANQTRGLTILEDAGLVTLVEKEDGEQYTLLDVVDNPNNYEFVSIGMGETVRMLEDLDASFSYGSSFITADKEIPNILISENPTEYTQNNLAVGLVVRVGDAESSWVEDVVEAYKSEQTEELLKERFGETIPVVD